MAGAEVPPSPEDAARIRAGCLTRARALILLVMSVAAAAVAFLALHLLDRALPKHAYPDQIAPWALAVISRPWLGAVAALSAAAVAVVHLRVKSFPLYLLGVAALVAAVLMVVGAFVAFLIPLYTYQEI